jgi:hypothetical protein
LVEIKEELIELWYSTKRTKLSKKKKKRKKERKSKIDSFIKEKLKKEIDNKIITLCLLQNNKFILEKKYPTLLINRKISKKSLREITKK